MTETTTGTAFAPGDADVTTIGVGRERQGAIYRAGVLGRTPDVPTDAANCVMHAPVCKYM